MEQLGELIILCAQRKDAVLWMQEGAVHVCVGRGALSKVFSACCNSGEEIKKIIDELTVGAYADNGASRRIAA